MSVKAINITIMIAAVLLLFAVYLDFNVSVSLKYECEDLDFLESIGKAKQVEVARSHCEELLLEKKVYQSSIIAFLTVVVVGTLVRVLRKVDKRREAG